MTGGTKKHDTEPYTAFYNSRVTTTGSVLFTQEGNLADQHVRDYTRLKNEGNSGKFYIAYQLKYSFQTNWNVEFNRTYYAGVFGYVVEPLGTSDHDDYNYDILKTSDYGYIMVGESVGLGPNNASCYLLKVDSMGATVTAPLVGMEDPATTLEFSVYPNPFAGQVYITGLQEYPDAKIELMDITGKVCLLRYAQGQNSVLDLTSFSGGIYFIRVTAGASTAIRKLVRQ
jgi:hypothetical protein